MLTCISLPSSQIPASGPPQANRTHIEEVGEKKSHRGVSQSVGEAARMGIVVDEGPAVPLPPLLCAAMGSEVVPGQTCQVMTKQLVPTRTSWLFAVSGPLASLRLSILIL